MAYVMMFLIYVRKCLCVEKKVQKWKPKKEKNWTSILIHHIVFVNVILYALLACEMYTIYKNANSVRKCYANYFHGVGIME